MDATDFNVDSDSSDEDFVPTGAVSDDGSANESIEEEYDSQGEAVDNSKCKKRKKSSKSSRKRIKTSSTPPVVEESNEAEKKSEVNDENKKKRADSLWADFLSDCNPKRVNKPNTEAEKKCTAKADSTSEKTEQSKTVKPTAVSSSSNKSIEQLLQEKVQDKDERNLSETKVFEFAGESVNVSCSKPEGTAPRRQGGGLASVLSQLKGGKNKLSTLEKSKLDWEMFKETEGISDELKTYNKGKNGFLEKRDFLERADLRQFEIEKNIRLSKRSNR